MDMSCWKISAALRKQLIKEEQQRKGKDMYQKQRKIKKLDSYIPAADLFRIFRKEKECVFLDSSLVNQLGHYSVIAGDPYLKLEKNEDLFRVNGKIEETGTFEEHLKKYLAQHRDKNESTLPIVSGAVGYFSYEYGRKKQGVPSQNEDIVTLPDAIVTFYDFFVIEDCHKKEIYFVANGITGDAEKVLKRAEEICQNSELRKGAREKESTKFEIKVFPNFTKEEYKQAVADMIQYIIEGDIYIANMTQQLTVESKKDPIDVFYDLREANPSPFGGYLDYGDYQIVCASPERFLKMKRGKINTRPIKGTRKRGETEEEDIRMRQELENSEKDKSELLMIVDLERNDLNRVCVPGSVKVTELFTVEEYATVFHLVSDIEGTLQEEKDVVDLLEAAFPGGSITGAPKYRAMEIIDELEHGKRNLYTGSIGYLTLNGDCDFNIVIRTALHKDGKYYLGVGGGITAESDLEFEYEETLQKAKAVLEAMK